MASNKVSGETIDRLTDIETVMNGYRECGLRLKAIDDSGVNDELSGATLQWADACIRLSIHTWSQTPGADFAFVEGVFGFYAGEDPGSIGN